MKRIFQNCKRNSLQYQVILLTICLMTFSASAAHGQAMSLEDCLRTTLENNDELQAVILQKEIRKHERNSVRGRFLPVVKTEANYLIWDKESKFEFDISFIEDIFAELIPTFAPFLDEETLAKLTNMETPDTDITIHEKTTWQANLVVAQPLTQLYQITSGYRAASQLMKSAEQDQIAKKREMELDVSKAYFGLITAEKMVKTAQAALEQIETIEKQVQAYLDVGVVETNAMMKVQVQKADIQKGMFQAQKGAKLAQAALNLYMNRPLATPVVPVEDSLDGFFNYHLELVAGQDVEDAVSLRPELLSGRHLANAARMGKHAAIGSMLPEINAVFNYDYNQGFGDLQPEEQYFGGLVLSWNIWEWGATFYQAKAAAARQAQAYYKLQYAESQIRLDVEQKRLNLEESEKNLIVAHARLDQAKENLRVENERYNVRQTTTADLLGAQTLFLQAESESIASELKVLEHRAAYHLAMGNDLLEDAE